MSTMESDDDAGVVAVKKMDFSVRVTDGAEVERWNVHELDCENESDGEDRVSGKNDH